MQYRVTGWGGLTGGARKEVDKGKKYVKFIAPAEGESSAGSGVDISTKSSEEKKKDEVVIYPEKPAKARFQPGRDRARHRRK